MSVFRFVSEPLAGLDPTASAMLAWAIVATGGALLSGIRSRRARARSSAIEATNAAFGQGLVLLSARDRVLEADDRARDLLWPDLEAGQVPRLPEQFA